MASVSEEFRHLDYSQLKDLRNKEKHILIDVREKSELDDTGSIPGAYHIPVFNHPPYFLDLGYHLFPHMKTWLATQQFDRDEEFQAGVKKWLQSQAVNLYDEGICKLVHQYVGEIDKALSMSEDDFKTTYSFIKPTVDDQVIFSCRSGKRSLMALEKALSQGYSKAKHYKGGWLDWEQHN